MFWQHRDAQLALRGVTTYFQKVNYQVALVESDEGVAVWCEDLPGCVSQGATKEEALENIREAIREYLAAVPEVERQFGTRVSREQVAI